MEEAKRLEIIKRLEKNIESIDTLFGEIEDLNLEDRTDLNGTRLSDLMATTANLERIKGIFQRYND